MWACFSNNLDPETLQACTAQIELQAQIRTLRAILEAHGRRLPEEARKALLEALEEAEAILNALTRDPVAERIKGYGRVREY